MGCMTKVTAILLLQSRPEDDVSDNEYEMICRLGRVAPENIERLRMERRELPEINLDQYRAIILGGGPANFAYDESQKSAQQRAYEPWLLELMRRIIAEDKPFLGLCFGIGAMSMALGLRPSFDYGESVGPVEVVLTDEGRQDPLFDDVSERFEAFVGHKEGIGEAPAGCVVLARSDRCVQMIRAGQQVYASQFHPELDHAGLALRVHAYKHHNYFVPEEAEVIIAEAAQADIQEPPIILRHFVQRYAAN